jgi:pheromone shutdown protein TraB
MKKYKNNEIFGHSTKLNTYNNISILGTNHIAKQSITEIKKAFKKLNPEIVCLELDSQRYAGLMSNKKQSFNPRIIKQVGVRGFFFSFIGGIVQKSFAKKTGHKPGVDMKTASGLAKKNNAKILLIDQPIKRTLWNISHKISKKDKKHFGSDIFWSMILALLGKKLFFKVFRSDKIRKLIYNRILFIGSQSFDINTIPDQDLVLQMMEKVRYVYPSVYKILIHDRNKFMATNLYNITLKNPGKKIIAIVGAGHVPGILELLRKYDAKN